MKKRIKPKLGDREIYYERHTILYDAIEPGFDDGWVHVSTEKLPPNARVLTMSQVRVALSAVILGQHPEVVIETLFGEESE